MQNDFWNYAVFSFYFLFFGIVFYAILLRKKIDGIRLSIAVVSGMIVLFDLAFMAFRFDPYLFQIRKISHPDLGLVNVPGLKVDVQFSAERNGDLLEMYSIDPEGLPSLPLNEKYEFPYQIDAFGFRNPSGDAPMDSDIVVIGDSYTIASSLPLEKGWVSVLRESSGKRVYQMATNQIGPQNYLEYLNFAAPRLKSGTKVLIAFFEGNDFANLDFQIENNRKANLANFLKFSWENIRKIFVSRKIVDIPWFLISGNSGLPELFPLLFFKNYVDDGLRSEGEFLEISQIVDLRRIFFQISDICQKHSLDCRVVYFPEKFRVYFPLIRDQFDYEEYFSKIEPDDPETRQMEVRQTDLEIPSGADYSRGNDSFEIPAEGVFEKRFAIREKWLIDELERVRLPFISLTEVLSKAAQSQLIYWPYDTHLNGFGNEMAGNALVRELSL